MKITTIYNVQKLIICEFFHALVVEHGMKAACLITLAVAAQMRSRDDDMVEDNPVKTMRSK